MRIDSQPIELYRTQPAQGVQGDSSKQALGPVQPTSPVQRSDQVEISDAGRAMAAQAQDRDASGELSAERMAEIRQRVHEGAYNTLEVVQEVAVRMLERGDI